MSLLSWLFGYDYKKRSRRTKYRRVMYYHVYKNSNVCENDPVCTFTRRWKAYSFARRITRQNHEVAFIVYTHKTASELIYDQAAENYRYGGN